MSDRHADLEINTADAPHAHAVGAGEFVTIAVFADTLYGVIPYHPQVLTIEGIVRLNRRIAEANGSYPLFSDIGLSADFTPRASRVSLR
jgi:hypothetical protein